MQVFNRRPVPRLRLIYLSRTALINAPFTPEFGSRWNRQSHIQCKRDTDHSGEQYGRKVQFHRCKVS